MKSATIPALRVQPELRQAAEEMLQPGETLSGFVEESLRRNVERRLAQRAFLARGLASRDAAKKSGKYVTADVVLSKLSRFSPSGLSGRRTITRSLSGLTGIGCKNT